jgi:hypothetical protein
MDWKELLASIVRSLAWPAVVVAIVLVLRKQFEALLARQDDLTLAREAKKKFEQALKEGQQFADWLSARLESQTVAAARVFSETDQNSPVTAILLAYLRLLDTVADAKKALNLPNEKQSGEVIKELVDSNRLSDRAKELFVSLTDARNAAIHCDDKEPITDGEAKEYLLQEGIMTALVQKALSQPAASSATQPQTPTVTSPLARSGE